MSHRLEDRIKELCAKAITLPDSSPELNKVLVSRLRGRAVQTSAPMTRKELGRFVFARGVDAKWLGSVSPLEEM
jgi:hypothetical protein